MVEAARYGKLTRTLRGWCPQDGRFNLDEALRIHRRPERSVHSGSDAEVSLHPRPAKVEESMPKPNLLVDFGSILKAEWRRLCGREHLDGAVPDLHLARGQFVVHCSVGPMADRAGHAQDVLAPNID